MTDSLRMARQADTARVLEAADSPAPATGAGVQTGSALTQLESVIARWPREPREE
jgi:hypothetical protein